jgi:hypothetical protein
MRRQSVDSNSNRVQNPFGRLLEFLDQLEEAGLHYDLKHVRDSIMVSVYIPAGMWEIEFFEDGTLEVELFKGGQGVEGVTDEWLNRFIEENKD